MGFPACETTVAVNSVNPKNRNLFKIGEYYYGFHMIKCDDTSTFADRNRYTEATIGYMNRWNVPIPNVNESHEFWGSYINAN